MPDFSLNPPILHALELTPQFASGRGNAFRARKNFPRARRIAIFLGFQKIGFRAQAEKITAKMFVKTFGSKRS